MYVHVNTYKLFDILYIMKRMIKSNELKKILKRLKTEIGEYKENKEISKRDFKDYEQKLWKRMHIAIQGFEYYVEKAIKQVQIPIGDSRGRTPILTLKQKTLLLLLKELIGKSNREMEFLCLVFGCLNGVYVSYKTIERLYSDDEVYYVLMELQKILLIKVNIQTTNISVCGDGTGYSLTISKHYASEAQKLKDKLKELQGQKKVKSNKKERKQLFVYHFTLMDIKSRMYVGQGTSKKSEKDAYNKAIKMALEFGIQIKDIRLDRYYSGQSTVKSLKEKFGNIQFFLIPKSNATIKGCRNWKQMLSNFVYNTKEYFTQYYQRNQSESGFSEDKRRISGKVAQKKIDRISCALDLRVIWHNLFWVGA